MVINGREIGFKMTVLASTELAALCPGGRIANIEKIFSVSDDVQGFEVGVKLIVSLNKGYEMAKAFETGEAAKPLTADEVMALDIPTFRQLMAEAIQALRPKRTVETEPAKK